MKRIYGVDEKFILAYNGEEITDAEWVERAEEMGKIWSTPMTFAFDQNDGEIYQGLWQIRVIDLKESYEESDDCYDRPVFFVPNEMTYRGMKEINIADLATTQGEVYEDFADFVVAFNNQTIPHKHEMQMFIGSMTLGLMEELLDILNDDGKVTIRLSKCQVDDIISLILGESARTRTIEDSIADSATKKSLAEYRDRILDMMNDIHAQLPNE